VLNHIIFFSSLSSLSPSSKELVPINLEKIQEFVTMRRLTPKPNELLTMKDLLLSGLFTNPMDGVKILGKVNINRNYIHSVLPY